jgi:hypothetical protein
MARLHLYTQDRSPYACFGRKSGANHPANGVLTQSVPLQVESNVGALELVYRTKHAIACISSLLKSHPSNSKMLNAPGKWQAAREKRDAIFGESL